MKRLLLLTLMSAAAIQAQERGPAPGDGTSPPREEAGGPLFVSPMGEPFRGDRADRMWFAAVDADGDGRLTPDEFRADAARFFAVLDQNRDGEIDPAEVDRYERVLLPETRVRDAGPSRGGMPRSGGGRGGPGSSGARPGGGLSFGSGDEGKSAARERLGAARFGYLDLPEPVTAADANLNRGIDRGEFAAAADRRFAVLDRNGDGTIRRSELPALARQDNRPSRGGPPAN